MKLFWSNQNRGGVLYILTWITSSSVRAIETHENHDHLILKGAAAAAFEATDFCSLNITWAWLTPSTAALLVVDVKVEVKKVKLVKKWNSFSRRWWHNLPNFWTGLRKSSISRWKVWQLSEFKHSKVSEFSTGSFERMKQRKASNGHFSGFAPKENKWRLKYERTKLFLDAPKSGWSNILEAHLGIELNSHLEIRQFFVEIGNIVSCREAVASILFWYRFAAPPVKVSWCGSSWVVLRFYH